MRIRPWHTLVLIVILAVVSGWLSLPSDAANFGGIKDDVYVHQGLDLQGGLQVLMEARPPEGESVDSDTLTGTRDTIERRVNALGVSEPLVQTRGDDQIIVELPGVEDPEQAIEVLQETALLEIINPNGQFLPEGSRVNTSLGSADSLLGDDAATPGASPRASPIASPEASPVASPEASPTASPVAEISPTPTGPVYETIVSGRDLTDAFQGQGQFGEPVVIFQLSGGAADRFYDFTSTHLGQPMSIVIDKAVISSPVIQGAISNEGSITGVPANEVDDLVVQLKAGALAVPLEVVQSRTVGPTLGQDSIDRSLVAGSVGLATVALFMIIYYRIPGVIAVVALLIYTSMTFTLFKLIPVTLTLAGIAGFILSIGMAVDANILIFARMKEELRIGRTLANAVEAGFDHAWPSIRDSNISSMITAAILYWFGRYTGASIVTGFALTLFIGVAVSMFTAIIVTRTFLRVMIGRGLASHRWWFGIEDHSELAPAGD